MAMVFACKSSRRFRECERVVDMFPAGGTLVLLVFGFSHDDDVERRAVVWMGDGSTTDTSLW